MGVDCSSEEFSKFTMPKILNKRGNDRSTNLFINGPVNAMCVNVLIRIFIQFQEVTLNCPYVQMELTLKSLEKVVLKYGCSKVTGTKNMISKAFCVLNTFPLF